MTKKDRSRFIAAVLFALGAHTFAAVGMKAFSRPADVRIPLNSIEVITEESSGGPPPHTAAQTTRAHSVPAAQSLLQTAAPSASSSTGGAAAIGGYLAQIRDRLNRAIRAPVSTSRELRAVLKLTLLHDGSLQDSSIDQSSGSREFDRSVIEASQRAKPYPPFTAEMGAANPITIRVPVVIRRRQ